MRVVGLRGLWFLWGVEVLLEAQSPSEPGRDAMMTALVEMSILILMILKEKLMIESNNAGWCCRETKVLLEHQENTKSLTRACDIQL